MTGRRRSTPRRQKTIRRNFPRSPCGTSMAQDGQNGRQLHGIDHRSVCTHSAIQGEAPG